MRGVGTATCISLSLSLSLSHITVQHCLPGGMNFGSTPPSMIFVSALKLTLRLGSNSPDAVGVRTALLSGATDADLREFLLSTPPRLPWLPADDVLFFRIDPVLLSLLLLLAICEALGFKSMRAAGTSVDIAPVDAAMIVLGRCHARIALVRGRAEKMLLTEQVLAKVSKAFPC